MKKFIMLLLLAFVSVSSFAKKDIDAWKNQNNLTEQYKVFKDNLKFWNGSYFLNEPQLDQFYKALTDSISVLKNVLAENAKTNNALQADIETVKNQLENSKVELNKSLDNQNSIVVFGQHMNKSFYSLLMYSIILGLVVFSGFVFLMYKRDRRITVQTRNEYSELKEEFDQYKKTSLERYTKINTELHHTRLQLNRKIPMRS